MTHWKKLTNPDYLGAYAIEGDSDIVVTIKSVGRELVIGADGKKEECTVAHFEERDVKPMILNATNCKIITRLYKTPYIEEWRGRKIAIHKESVKAFGDIVEALRVRPVIPKVAVKNEKVYTCADCGVVISPVKGLTATEAAQRSADKFGKILCVDCARKASEDKTRDDTADDEATELLKALENKEVETNE